MSLLLGSDMQPGQNQTQVSFSGIIKFNKLFTASDFTILSVL